MSRLVEKLTNNNRTAAPLGFQMRQVARSQPKLLLVAVTAVSGLDDPAGDLTAADAGLLETAGLADIEKAVSKFSDIPWGARPDDGGAGPAELAGAGADFILFSVDSPAGRLPKDSEAGQVIEINGDLDENWLRSVNKLPLDLALFTGEDLKITWRRLMLIRYCADLVSKPVLVQVSPDITESELAAVWAAGAEGVVVADRVGDLRKLIDGLEPPAPRRKDKAMALLPRVSAGEEDEDIEEPDDE